MPLELGIFLGAQRFGGRVHKRKNCLVVDRERYRYEQFISDIAGQDIAAHGDWSGRLIGVVRDWLRADTGGRKLPGPARLRARLAEFEEQLPEIAARGEVQVAELTFSDISNIIAEWLRQRDEIG